MHKSNARRNKIEGKEETLFLECQKKGTTMECKPAKKLAKGHEQNSKNFGKKRPTRKHKNNQRVKEKSKEKVLNLEAKLLKKDRKMAELLHKAIHEAHEHVPSFTNMLQLVNEIIDEEYQKHSKLIIKTDVRQLKIDEERRQQKQRRKKRRHRKNRQKLQQNSLNHRQNESVKNAKLKHKAKQMSESNVKTADTLNDQLKKKDKSIRYTKQPLETVKTELEKKKIAFNHKQKHESRPLPNKEEVQKVKANIRRIMEKNNASTSTHQTVTSEPSSNVDLNYILNRLASKRKEFLDKVMCSSSKKNERTFEQVVDVPWIGFPHENTFLQGQTYHKTYNRKFKKPHSVNMNLKTPSLKVLPTKVNHYMDDEGSGEGSSDFDEESDESTADFKSRDIKKNLLKSIFQSAKSKPALTTFYSSTLALALQKTERLSEEIQSLNDEGKRAASSYMPNMLIGSNIESSETVPYILSLSPTPAYHLAMDNLQVGHMTIMADPNEFAGFSTYDEIFPDEETKEGGEDNTNVSIKATPSYLTAAISTSITSGLNKIDDMVRNDHFLSSVSATVSGTSLYGESSRFTLPIMDEILAETFDRSMNAYASLSRLGGEKNTVMPSSSSEMIFSNMIQATVYIPNENQKNESHSMIGKNFIVRLKMLTLYNNTLVYQRNSESKKLKKLLQESVTKLYKDDDSFHSCKLVSFSRLPKDNMTLVDIEIYFKTRAHDHLQKLEESLKNSHELAHQPFDDHILEMSLLNDRITDIRWCLPPCYNPYHCFPLCDETCCSTPPNAFDTSQTPRDNQPPQKSASNAAPYIVYNYIVTTPEEFTKHARDVFGSKPYEINAFTSQVDAETGNVLCGPYCSPYYCLPTCFKKCCFRK